jgi:hypothetical protein
MLIPWMLLQKRSETYMQEMLTLGRKVDQLEG